MTFGEAKTELLSMVSAELEPVLSDADITLILARNQRAETWTASHAYQYGARVEPSPPNGRYLKCVRAGTSGATQPTWNCEKWYGKQLDGTSEGGCYWADGGPAHAQSYDLQGAAHDAWTLKAERVAHEVNIADKDSKADLIARHEELVKTAARYRPMWVR